MSQHACVVEILELIAVDQVKEIESEEELDDILKADARPLVLLAGFTWCRPCKVSRACYWSCMESGNITCLCGKQA
jgi:hypothetical protein